MATVAQDYVADFLRQHDPDRYRASLVVFEPAARAAIQAVWAFSADVASIRERVSQPVAGEMRLQWWTDALAGRGHGAVSQNPIAAALFDAIAQFNLPTSPLERLVEARRFDLYDDPMPDLPSFEGYAGETNSILYQYAAVILNGGREAPTADLSGHLGVGHALIGHLRARGHYAARGQIFLPVPVLAAHGVSVEELLSGRASEGLTAALSQLQDMAAEHLQRAGSLLRHVPRPLRPAFALLPVLEAQLRQLRRKPQGGATTDISDLRKLALLSAGALRGIWGRA